MTNKGKRRDKFKNKRSTSTTVKQSQGTKLWKPPSKAGRIVLRNLPFDVTEDGIENHFIQYGDIRDIKLLRRQDGKLTGCGFVQFTRRDDASEAIKICNGKAFMGRKITVDWAVPKCEYIANQIIARKSKANNEPQYIEIKQESEDEESKLLDVKDHLEGDGAERAKKIKKERKKISNRKGRIIVRNLPFKVTDDTFKKHFAKFGDVTESTLLRKPDGKLIGCGFIQFKSKQDAIKAILGCSGKELLGRVIICDWALPKDKYLASEAQSHPADEVKPKEEAVEDGKIEIKEELLSEDSESEVKNDDDSDVSDATSIDHSISYNESDSAATVLDHTPERRRPKVISNDVSEGRTVFIKNVPFSATKEDVRSCMEQFGPVYYALICIDPLTEHSKGTAFVKFKTVEDTEKCLSAGTELKIVDQIVDVHKALNKEDLQKKREKKSEKAKDNRHLYLIKEGVILAGSSAAKGLSVSDMDKRLQLEQWKTQILRNLNMFVSRFRLVVHNIPPTWDDARVRKLFLTEAGPGAVITEARVMRDMKNTDAQGVGMSKELAFVGFTTHEHALQSLRNINNNPNIFTKTKRPIVAFSIENKAIHKVKQQRMQKSRAKNPLYNNTNKKPMGDSKKTQNNYRTSKKRKMEYSQETSDPNNFTGIAAEPGSKKLRTKFNLRTQSALHVQSVRTDKHKQKMSRKMSKHHSVMTESVRQPKQKQNSRRNPKGNDVAFSKLVNKYKTKLTSVVTKKKWYE